MSIRRQADTGSFGDAAESLGASQPALSRTIQQIEGKLGTRLFDGDTRKLRLTPAGERLELLAPSIDGTPTPGDLL